MYRICLMNSEYLAVDMGTMVDTAAIEGLTEDGNPVIICQNLDDLWELGVDPDTVKVIE